MSEKVNKAVEYFDRGYNCSQAITGVYGPEFGLDEDVAIKISACLGGGIGRMGHICGALSGVCCVLGLCFGTDDPRDKQTKFRVYDLAMQAAEKFKNLNGKIYCKDLLGFEMLTEEGAIKAKEKTAFQKCPGYVRSAAEILEEILEEN